MAIHLLNSEERGLIKNDMFEGHTLFSNGNLTSSRPDEFGAIYVFNDDVLYPGSYLGMHPHENVEIVTIMVSGTESHKDSLGVHENYQPGDVQLISSGKGLFHEGGNVSNIESARHLQIWIAPKFRNLAPTVSVKKAKASEEGINLLVSPDASFDSLKINQDVWIFKGRLQRGKCLDYSVQKFGNGVMLYVVQGKLTINSSEVEAENTAFIRDQDTINIVSRSETSEFVLIETIR